MKKELTEREKLEEISTRLYSFTHLLVGKDFIPSQHLKDISYRLEEVALGKKKRLMVNTPPRYGKSLLVSTVFPFWQIVLDPSKNILIITYGKDLSENIGTNIRRYIEEYGHLFDIYLSRHTHSKTKIKFQNGKGKEYKGSIEITGYSGSITGKDADIIVIDDLIKNLEEALSPTITEKIIDFYKSAIYTRIFEDTAIILVSTRYAKNDLAGHLLENSVEQWERYILPAVNSKGESTFPQRFSTEHMKIVENEEGAFIWSALYMQNPVEIIGDIFEGEFKIVKPDEFDIEEDFSKFVRYWDRASTKKGKNKDPDWTVGLLMGKLKDTSTLFQEKKVEYVVLDIVRFRDNPAENERRIYNTAVKDGAKVEIYMEIEGGSSGKDTIDNYKRNILSDFKFKGQSVSKNKEVRALPVAAAVGNGKVGFLRTAKSFLGPLFIEMRAFPYGSHDDQVDTLSGSFSILSAKKTKLKRRKRRRR